MFGSAKTAARFAVLPVLALVALFAWALSSPPGSSPDEDYHLVSVWCGQGEDAGRCEDDGREGERTVLEGLPRAPCFAFQSAQSAACQDQWFAEENEDGDLIRTNRGNFEGNYPPVFYFTMNFFVGDDIPASVLVMRLVNAAIFVGLMGATYGLLPRERRPMLLLGTVVTLVPLSAFLIPSINPSSWAIISGAVAFPALVGFFETRGRRRLGLGVILALAVVLGAGARADAALYLAIAVVLAVLLSTPWRQNWKLLALPALLVVACAAAYLTSGQSAAASNTVGATSNQTMSVVAQLFNNILNVPTLWAGAFGSWGLGWLDTTLPAIVFVLNLMVYGGVLFLGIRHLSARKGIALGLLVAALVFIPVWVLLQTGDLVGAGVQPRYLLPLLVLLAQVALYRLEPGQIRFSRTQLWCIAAALSATNAVALHANIRRYVAGADLVGPNLDAGREWWWSTPVPPNAVWLVGSVAFGLAMVICARALMPPWDDAPVPPQAPEAGSERTRELADAR